MGLTKEYLRYSPSGLFGVVAGKQCNGVYLEPRRFIATGGTNAVILWDIRLNRKVHVFGCESSAVVLQPNHDYTLLAVGHVGGSVSIYDLKDKSEEASPDPNVTFEGHTSEVLTMDWDSSGTILASGGKDTRIVLWDCVSETGVVKLKGHKGPVTRLRYWKDSKYLVSSSTDTTLRIWDLITNTCVHTLSANTQIRDFCIWGNYFFIGEQSVRLFLILEEGDELRNEELGVLTRTSNDSVRKIGIVGGKYLVVAGSRSPIIDLFHLNSPTKAEKKRATRIQKEGPDVLQTELILSDLVRQGESSRASEVKLRSFDAYEDEGGTLRILLCLPSNQVEQISFNPQVRLSKEEKAEMRQKKKFDLYGFDGHRNIVRGLAFSSDKTGILAASGDAFKIWHRASLSCVLTVPHHLPVVTCSFCPGDRHFIAGTSCGKLILGDVASGSLIQTQQTGEDEVWGLDVFSNNLGFVASNGPFLNFYDFSMSDGSLRFDLQRQLEVKEKILSVCLSPNMRVVAVGLLDSTIKVYYFDTLKFHLSLYGHKLPVVSIHISSDNNLLASCSGDKSVKIWGLDFGDCHSSLLHSDGLVGVSFIENTHHLISVARNSINFYDGDTHTRIQTLKAHSEGGAMRMAVGGLFLVTSGRDQSLRLFNRTDEILVVDDEREREREEEMEKEATTENPTLPALQTGESERTADKLMEALDVLGSGSVENHPLLQAYGAKSKKEFLPRVLSLLKAGELEQSLSLLPLSYVHALLPALADLIHDFPLATELGIGCLSRLVTSHLPSVRTGDKTALVQLGRMAEERARELRDLVGFNCGGLQFLRQRELAEDLAEEFGEILGERKRRRKKRERGIKRALLSLHQ